MNQTETSYWQKCSVCKKAIPYGVTYYVCSVSTCNRKRNPMLFCSDSCWDMHLPVMNHREASCFHATAPQKGAANNSAAGQKSKTADSGEIIVVASKVKDYIRENSGMSTAGGVLETLSDFVRATSDQAIENAKANNRQTVMARDIRTPLSSTGNLPNSAAGVVKTGIIRRRPK